MSLVRPEGSLRYVIPSYFINLDMLYFIIELIVFIIYGLRRNDFSFSFFFSTCENRTREFVTTPTLHPTTLTQRGRRP